MTEQEAQMWVARLVRIWKPDELSEQWTLDDETENFQSKIHLEDDVILSSHINRSLEMAFQIRKKDKKSDTAFLLYFTGSSHIRTYKPFPHTDEFAQLIAKYLPVFRRGLWLSGCTIEATAHEKMEWMQEFSREEIEAWDLKI